MRKHDGERSGLSSTAYFLVTYSLPLKFLFFFLYYVVGVAFYNKNEGWTVLESVYFITVTMTTCGYGYFHPSSDDSKIFTIFFIFFGLIIILTVVNGIVNSVLFDAQEGVIRSVHGFINGGEDSYLSDSSLRFYKVTCSFGAILLMLLIGTLFYSGNEDWSTTDAAYWTVCTMTTVGYGDLIIKYDSSRLFAIFFILSCVLIYTTAAGNLIEVYIEAVTTAAASRNELPLKYDEFEGKFSDTWVDELLPEGSAIAISREKAILVALVELGILDSLKDIQPLNQVSNGEYLVQQSVVHGVQSKSPLLSIIVYSAMYHHTSEWKSAIH